MRTQNYRYNVGITPRGGHAATIRDERTIRRRLALVFVLTLLVTLGVVSPAVAAPGDPDTSFGDDGDVFTLVAPDYSLYGGGAQDVAVQPDGKIVAAGSAKNEAGDHDFALARYTADGSLDTSFGTDGKIRTGFGAPYEGVNAISLQADGKIVVAGTSAGDFALARYNADGSLDTTFDSDGKVTTDLVNGGAQDVVVQPDGKITVAGTEEGPQNNANSNFVLIRYNADGILDTSFDTDGKVVTDFSPSPVNWHGEDVARALALQTDGKILVAGDTEVATQVGGSGTNDFALARYNADGSLDTSFDGDGKVTTDLLGSTQEQGFALSVQPDGKVVMGGEYYNGSDTDYALTRYNIDGSLDSSFDSDGKVITNFQLPNYGPSHDRVQDLAVGFNGKIVAAGSGLARYNADGSLDTSFGENGRVAKYLGATIPDTIHSIALQSDDKIVLALRHENFHVARYHGGDDSTAPGPASALTANAQGSDVSLTWNHPADDDFEATRIVRRADDYASGPFDGTKVYEGGNTTHTDTRVKNGTYYYTAFARDTNGNWAAAARASVEVYVTPPTAIIGSGPSGTVYDPDVGFSFSSDQPNVTFECDLTLGPDPSGYFYPCNSPKEYTNLEDAEWTFHVRATNDLGNSSVTSRTFTVDTMPNVQITSGPQYSQPSEASVSFEFSTVEPPESLPVSGYECRLDEEPFSPCTSPKAYSDLSDGYHFFHVRALNSQNEPGQEDAEVWRVDSLPPTDMNIHFGPVENANTGLYNVSTASFRYSANDPTLQGFECSLDGVAFDECPLNGIQYSSLADGEHTFRARAVDALGHVSQIASRTWVVDTVGPEANITSGPSGTVSASLARFTLSSNEEGVIYRCKLDNEVEFTACLSPQEYSGLVNGEHTFSVHAVDRAGNTGPTVSRTWTIAPEATSADLNAGGTLTSDAEGDGATAFDPMETQITSPVAGTVSVTETTVLDPSAAGYSFLSQQANIEAPPSTPEDPLRFVFAIDASMIPAGENQNTIQVFRNGVRVEACTDQSGTATPDPCVLSRNLLADGDVEFTVLTSHASHWNLGVVEHTAPTVQGVTPANLAKKISATANLTATFSEAMKASTINKRTFFLVKKGTTKPLDARVSYSASTRKATLNPTLALKPGATYIATVTTGVMDLSGNALDQDPNLAGNQVKRWSFTIKR